MNIKDHTVFEHKRLTYFYRALKESCVKKILPSFSKKKLKDNKTAKVLLKVIQRLYDKNPEIQEVIDASMKEVCAEEGVSPEHLFFCLTFSFMLSLS